MNSNSAVLSIDIGTSTVKCGIIDANGVLRAVSRTPSGSGDPAQSWEKSLLAGLARLEGDIGSAAGVTICGNGPTIIPVDSAGEPCGPTVTWNHPGMSRLEGTSSLFLPVVSKAAEHASRDVRWYCGCPEYFSARMTGTWNTFLPSQQFIPFIWDKPEAEAYGIPWELLPPMLLIGEPAGRVTASFASRSGIPEGIPVFSGGPDYLLSLLGTDITRPGRVCDRAGTSEALNLCISGEHIQKASSAGLRILPHCIDGLYSAAALLPLSGLHFLSLLRAAQEQGISSGDLASGIFNEYWIDDSLGALIRLTHDELVSSRIAAGNMKGLPYHGDWEVSGRVISEAVGFAARRGLEQLHDAGPAIEVLRISGGQALNDRWNQLKADILNTPIEVPGIADAELLGCAAVSLTSLGRFESLTKACGTLYRPARVITPDPRRSALFAQRYKALF